MKIVQRRSMALLAVACAFACSPEQAPLVEEEAEDALTASVSDIDVRIYDDTLTRYVANVNAQGSQNGWMWSVRDPSVDITSAGVRLRGTMVVRPVPIFCLPGTKGCTSFSFPTRVYSAPFDRSANITFTAGQLRFSVSSSPVSVSRVYNGVNETLVSVDLSPEYRTSLAMTGMSLAVSGRTVTIDADDVEISHFTGYSQVLATFDVD